MNQLTKSAPAKTGLQPRRIASADAGTAPAVLMDLRGLIEQTQQQVASAVNSALTLLYWQVGERISRETLLGERAAYGQDILPTLSAKLVPAYGKGFSERNLARMISFAQVFPDQTIVVSLIRQLSWSHFIEILPLKQPLEREFYAEMCRIERWSVRTLRERIGGQLYLRTAIAKKPDAVISQELSHLREGGQLTPDMVFRDPYVLDFLGLAHGYSERDLEAAILREMERFLLELGAGFTFVARQKRMSVGADDFYLDLLFYHRTLRRLVAVELKLEKFSPAHKGQMELYLRWLNKYDRAEGELAPIGLILCASSDAEQVEIMDLMDVNQGYEQGQGLDQPSIHVAQYLHALPELAVLQAQLHKAVALARERHALLTNDTSPATQSKQTKQGMP
jgi:predicted nuclease of restriction endonuclease-like (RecB) superfamily